MTIKMYAIAPVISSRDVVEILLDIAKPKEQSEFILDFSDVEFISRSAAHEILAFSRNYGVQIINTGSSVKKMFEVVRDTDHSSMSPAGMRVEKVDIQSLLKA